MDRLLYTAMSGASHAMLQQSVTANNLANISTPGFRAQLSAFRAVPILGEGLKTRAFVVESTPGSSFQPGTIQSTGRDLDVAVQSQGWIAVQTSDGEGYTRNGSFKINADGLLTTQSGTPILGDGGPITIPQDSVITIARDGTVSAITIGGKSVESVGRIKLVNPDEKNLIRGNDGFFRSRAGGAAPIDENVSLTQGAIESSNVNASEGMVQMISQARLFEMQMKVLQTAETNARVATQIINLSA